MSGDASTPPHLSAIPTAVPCTICDSPYRAAVENEISAGCELVDVGLRYGISEQAIERHIHCMEEEATVCERALREHWGQLREAVEIAADEYGRITDQNNAYALSSLSSQFQACTQQLQGFKDPEKAAEAIVENVLNPLIREVIRKLEERLGQMRDSVGNTLGINEQTEMESLTEEVNSAVRLISSDFKDLISAVPGTIKQALRSTPSSSLPRRPGGPAGRVPK